MLSVKQFDFKNDQNFDPSVDTKKFWMFTNKNKTSFAGVELPGLFNTSGYPLQTLGFLVIFILEGSITWFGAAQGVAWPVITFAIVLDIFIACGAHSRRNKICEYENKLVVEKDPVIKAGLQRKLNSAWVFTCCCYFIIFFSAGFKFFYFFQAYMYFDIIAVAALSFYLISAVLHIFCTGYFIYTSRFNYYMMREYSQFVLSKRAKFAYSETPLIQPINVEGTNAVIEERKEGNHAIIKTDDNYYFETMGIMTDKQLSALISVQKSEVSRSIVAREGLRVQLIILETGLSFNNQKNA